MARNRKYFLCSACGSDFPKWQGKCAVCGEWNTIVEAEAPAAAKTALPAAGAVDLGSVEFSPVHRILTGIGEFNLVCGGGVVPGSVILIGGEPGIGKSTLALQIAGYFKTLYISGEESPVQIRLRAERIGCNMEGIRLSASCGVEQIIGLAEAERPQCIIVDSIQTLYTPEIPGLKGSVSQVRESASRLADAAKRINAVILIGHITKEGAIAGPKLLEHLVDTVLYFEGNFSRDYRVLRAFKNRYGSVNEIGLFRMEERGLVEVTDKNKIFLNPYLSQAPGNAVSAAVEGSRIILFEVQSLVTASAFPNPRRMADGFDLNRLILITAVLEKHAGLKIAAFDVFINVSGGFQINDTAADLAVAVSIASSFRNRSVPHGVGLLGEISLSGEIRPVSLCGRRIQEFKHSGFNTLVLPEAEVSEAKAIGFDGTVIGVRTVQDAIDRVFE